MVCVKKKLISPILLLFHYTWWLQKKTMAVSQVYGPVMEFPGNPYQHHAEYNTIWNSFEACDKVTLQQYLGEKDG